MVPNIGPLEIVVLLDVALLVFGPKRLPSLASSMGKGIRSFKDGVTDITGSDDPAAKALKPEPEAAAPADGKAR